MLTHSFFDEFSSKVRLSWFSLLLLSFQALCSLYKQTLCSLFIWFWVQVIFRFWASWALDEYLSLFKLFILSIFCVIPYLQQTQMEGLLKIVSFEDWSRPVCCCLLSYFEIDCEWCSEPTFFMPNQLLLDPLIDDRAFYWIHALV